MVCCRQSLTLDCVLSVFVLTLDCVYIQSCEALLIKITLQVWYANVKIYGAFKKKKTKKNP